MWIAGASTSVFPATKEPPSRFLAKRTFVEGTMGPGNNSGVSMSVPLRELKILLKDPENGALLAPHLELAITQACGARG